MALTGRALLILGLAVAVFGACASLYGVRTGRREWVDCGRRSVYTLAALMTLAFVILEAAFLRSDFSFNVVAGHSSTTTPTFYKMTAPWSSQEGSLLLWVWLLSLWSSLVLFLTRRQGARDRALRDRDPARLRHVLPVADGVLRKPVRDHLKPARRGRRPGSAAASPQHDDPPADAVLGVHAADDPVRVRGGRADHGQARRRSGSR